jgi:hypothetical protein
VGGREGGGGGEREEATNRGTVEDLSSVAKLELVMICWPKLSVKSLRQKVEKIRNKCFLPPADTTLQGFLKRGGRKIFFSFYMANIHI